MDKIELYGIFEKRFSGINGSEPVIDIWEMTRTVAKEETAGKLQLRLPGKEGIAILVTRLEGEALGGSGL